MNKSGKAGLSLAFLCVAGAVWAAHLTPAKGYEWSIYTNTPSLTWAGLAIAVFSVLIITQRTPSNKVLLAASIPVLLAAVVALSLPLIRGYFHMGQADSLTQLGIIVDILQGEMGGLDVIYPIFHYFAVVLTLVSDKGANIAAQLAILIFAVSFLLSTSVLGRKLGNSNRVGFVALIGASMMLPLMTVRLPIYGAIPTTAAALFLPTILLGAMLCIQNESGMVWNVRMIGLYLLLFAGVFLHPVLGVVLIVFFAIYREVSTYSPFIYVAITVVIAYTRWMAEFSEKLTYFLGLWSQLIQGGGFGSSISSAGQSLSQIGISLEMLALKLTVPRLFALGMAGVLFMVLLRNWHKGTLVPLERRQLGFLLALAPLGVLVVGFLALGLSNQWSRYLGMALGPITAIAAIAAVRFASVVPRARTTGCAIAMALLIVSTLVFYPSPWLVRPNPQVTDAQMAGYSHVADYGERTTKLDAVSAEPRRFRNAHYGAMHKPAGVEENYEKIVYRPRPDSVAPDALRQYYTGKTYFVSSEIGRTTHRRLYEEVVYHSDNFTNLQETARAKIYTNGDTRIYLIRGLNNTAQ